jgi:hypothetical protein
LGPFEAAREVIRSPEAKTNVSLPAPPVTVSGPAPPWSVSLPFLPDRLSLPSPPWNRSAYFEPSTVSWPRPASKVTPDLLWVKFVVALPGGRVGLVRITAGVSLGAVGGSPSTSGRVEKGGGALLRLRVEPKPDP